MKSKDWLIIVFCLILSGVLLTAASMRVGSIHQAREDMGLVANASLENAPPSLAFATVAMGANLCQPHRLPSLLQLLADRQARTEVRC